LPTRIALCVVLALTVAAAGCGGSGNLLVPIVDTVFEYKQQFTNLERLEVFVADFLVTAPGTLHITVDWTSSANDIDLVLSNPACDSAALEAGTCKIFATDLSNLKPAEITMATTATGYRLFVINRGPQSESGTIVVTVTQIHLRAATWTRTVPGAWS
jgi:hypothetical protein